MPLVHIQITLAWGQTVWKDESQHIEIEKKNGCHFADKIFKYIFQNIKCFYFDFKFAEHEFDHS